MLRSRSDKVAADAAQLQELNGTRQAIADWLTSIAVCLKARVSFDTQPQTSVLRLQSIAGCVDDRLVTDDTASTDGFIAYTCIRHAYVALLQAVPLLGVKSSTFTPYLAEPFTRSPVPQLRAAYEVIRANLTLRSATFRHAVRLAIALAVAVMIYRVSPFPRGYWLPLTTLVILKPEFSTTFSRGFARVLGTLNWRGVCHDDYGHSRSNTSAWNRTGRRFPVGNVHCFTLQHGSVFMPSDGRSCDIVFVFPGPSAHDDDCRSRYLHGCRQPARLHCLYRLADVAA